MSLVGIYSRWILCSVIVTHPESCCGKIVAYSGVFLCKSWIFDCCRKSLTLHVSIQLLIPHSPSPCQPVKALLGAPYPIRLSRSDITLWLLRVDFLLECAVEIGKGDIELDDVEVANGWRFQMAARARVVQRDQQFAVIDTRMLSVALSNELTLILLKSAVLELSMKYPAEFEVPHTIRLRH